MGLVTKANNKSLMKGSTGEVTARGLELAGALFNQFQEFHSTSHWDDREIEELLIRQKQFELNNQEWFTNDEGILLFSPSSASKCERELMFKLMKGKRDEQKMFPYQQRWVRNSTAVHGETQRDLLYMEKKLKNPAFTVQKNEAGLPKWEKSNAQIQYYEHNGEKFGVAGMMDGMLTYVKDGTSVGFEFKTKTNSVAQIGNYKMKDAQEGHKTQCVGYSLIFGVDEYILMYEAVAKDNWMKGAEARDDIRNFYIKVGDAEKNELLDKFARVIKAVKEEQLPPKESDKCLFCEFKTICLKGD